MAVNLLFLISCLKVTVSRMVVKAPGWLLLELDIALLHQQIRRWWRSLLELQQLGCSSDVITGMGLGYFNSFHCKYIWIHTVWQTAPNTWTTTFQRNNRTRDAKQNWPTDTILLEIFASNGVVSLSAFYVLPAFSEICF